MIKYLMAVFVALLLFQSCESATESYFEKNEFMPLKVGNKWYWNHWIKDTTSVDEIWEVVGWQKVNCHYYFKVARYNGPGDTTISYFYFRIDNNTLFRKWPGRDETILADFSLNLNEEAYWSEDLFVTKKDESTIVFQKTIGLDLPQLEFKKGIGLTRDENFGVFHYRHKLVGYEIK